MAENPQGYAIYETHNPVAIQFGAIDGSHLSETTTLVGGVGQRIAPMYAVFVGDDITGWTKSPTISIGTNSPNFDNVMPSTQITGLTTTNDAFIVLMPKSSRMPNIGEDLSVAIRAVGTATTYIFRAYLIGFVA